MPANILRKECGAGIVTPDTLVICFSISTSSLILIHCSAFVTPGRFSAFAAFFFTGAVFFGALLSCRIPIERDRRARRMMKTPPGALVEGCGAAQLRARWETAGLPLVPSGRRIKAALNREGEREVMEAGVGADNRREGASLDLPE